MSRFAVMLSYAVLIFFFLMLLLHIKIKAFRAYVLEELHVNVFLFQYVTTLVFFTCRVNCSFYFKIGACRHGDRCSRLHNKPTFSQVCFPFVFSFLWKYILASLKRRF